MLGLSLEQPILLEILFEGMLYHCHILAWLEGLVEGWLCFFYYPQEILTSLAQWILYSLDAIGKHSLTMVSMSSLHKKNTGMKY